MVLVSTGITDEERKSYKKVVEKLDEYFHVRHNVIFERARFNRRDQLEGESGDQYITELYYLAERCSYGQLTSEMIRDRLVVGIRDLALSERLQLNPDLTLEKAKTMIRQREAVHTQQQVLKEAESGSSFKGENSSMDFLRGQGTKTKPAGVSSAKPKQTPKQCIKCGKGQHPWYTCPAKESVCHKCKRRGHYGSQCLSKTVAELQPDESNLDSAFLDTLTQNSPETWRVKLKLANQTLEFKIDTGAEVTAISDAAFRALKGLKLDRPKKMLYGPARTLLKVIGQFEGELFYRGKTTRQKVYVVNGLRTNLLGLPAILALKLVAKLEETVEASLHTIVEKYPTLFQGLGSMGDPYDIQLQPEAQPYALFTSRNIPLPLRLKVKQELERMEVRCRKQWMEVEDVKLYEEHRCILESNKWVDDVLINASQFLLHSQYGQPGFQATTLAYNLRFNVMREFIQIQHNGEDHWVTISTIGLPSGHVNVFDSLYDTCNSFIIEQICAILCTPNDAVHLHFMDTVKQTNHSDCGLYAIAFAVDLCSGQDVCKRNYSAVLMRPHLYKIEDLLHFLLHADRPISSRAIAQKKSVHVRCYCRMPDAGLMIQCDSCKEWFHKECDISIPKEAWNNKKYKWNCKKCQPIH